ncbi:MAG: non-canonical purine NTP pyrophosphatase [Candidatus Nanoarchaeia archaeon]
MKPQKQILFITGNEDKFREFKEIMLKISLKRKDLDLPELQGTPESIVKEKARIAAKITKKPCFVDDTSLCFNSWGGMPGPYIKHFLEYMGAEKLATTLIKTSKDITAKAITSIGYCEPKKEPVCIQGITNGKISLPKGNKNFKKGWDSIFIPNGSTKTNAEMEPREKHIYSQRTKAIRLFEEFLENKR